MAGKLHCPHCDERVPSHARSQHGKIRCPHCGGVFRDRDDEDDSHEVEENEARRPRRGKKNRSRTDNKGLVIGLSLGGVAVLVVVTLIVMGSSRGWFRKGAAADPQPQAPFQAPVADAEKASVPVNPPKPKLPNKELQKVFERITFERLSVEAVEKLLGPAREMTPATLEALFNQVAFKKQIFEQFDKNRQDLKVQRWLFWEREGGLLIVGMSRFREGKTGISMIGIWNENNRAFFNMSLRAHPADIE